VTGIFSERYILKCVPARCLLPNNFSVKITRDSNTLDKAKAWPYRHSDANCDFRYRHICKFRCGPTSLVYLENTHGNSSRALRNKVSRHAHRPMRTASVCRSRQLERVQERRQSGSKSGSKLASSARVTHDLMRAVEKPEQKPEHWPEQNHRAKARNLFEG